MIADAPLKRPYCAFRDLSHPTVAERLELTFPELATALTTGIKPNCPEDKDHPSKADKSQLPMWGPWSFPNDTRAKGSPSGDASCLVFDVDQDPTDTLDGIASELEGLSAVVTTTPSSKAAFRVVIETDRPITAAEYPTFWGNAKGLFRFGVGTQAKSLGRVWSCSCHPLDGGFAFRILPGKPLCVDDVLAVAPTKDAPKAGTTPKAGAFANALDAKYQDTAHTIGKAWAADLPTAGERHYSAGDIAACLYDRGMPGEQVPALVEAAATVAVFGALSAKRAYAETTIDNIRAGGLSQKQWNTLAGRRCTRVVKAIEGCFPLDDILPTVPNCTINDPNPDVDTWGLIDWTAQETPREWLVQGIVQQGTVCVFYGEPNSLKTWTALSVAGAVHSGSPWLGRATKQGSVCMLDYEGGRYDVKRRMALLKQRPDGIRYINPEWMLNDAKLWQRLEQVRPALLIVDSLARGMLGLDENDTGISEPLARAKQLSREHGTTTIFIHHKNKSGKTGQASMRGSGALYAATEGAFEFVDYERLQGNVHRATMHCDRQKEGEAFDDIPLELSDAKGLVKATDATTAAIPRDELTVDGVKGRLLLQVSAHAEGCGEKMLLRKAGLTSVTARDAGKRALAELVESLDVVRTRSNRGYNYHPKTNVRPPLPADKKAEVFALIMGGLHGATELASGAGIDALDLLEMVKAKEIYKSSHGYAIDYSQVKGTAA